MGRTRVLRRGLRRRRRVARRRTGGRTTGGSQRSFNAKLIKATGLKKTWEAAVQCEWKVLPTQTDGIGSTAVRPRAQWMWPREPGAQLRSWVIAPEYTRDWQNIMTGLTGNAWTLTNIDDMYNYKVRLGYRARYSVTNQTNAPVDYKYYICKWRRDIPKIEGTDHSFDFENIFNVAGAYLAKMQDPTVGPPNDATNQALTYETENFLTYPVIRDLIKVTKSGKFTLDAGDNKAINISRRVRQLNLLKLYRPFANPDPPVQFTPEPAYQWEKGDSFVLFRMFSRPADYGDSTIVALDAKSTRTTPVSLLSYTCKYFSAIMQPLSSVQHATLPSYGLQDSPDETKINVVADDDVKAVPERRAV